MASERGREGSYRKNYNLVEDHHIYIERFEVVEQMALIPRRPKTTYINIADFK